MKMRAVSMADVFIVTPMGGGFGLAFVYVPFVIVVIATLSSLDFFDAI